MALYDIRIAIDIVCPTLYTEVSPKEGNVFRIVPPQGACSNKNRKQRRHGAPPNPINGMGLCAMND
jgi:hypothetical protein